MSSHLLPTALKLRLRDRVTRDPNLLPLIGWIALGFASAAIVAMVSHLVH